MTRKIGRREVMARLARLAMGTAAVSPVFPLGRALEALALPGPKPSPASGPSRAVVALGRREGICPTVGGPLDLRPMREALGATVARAAGEATPVAAFRKLFTPRDVVGIKVNCIAGRGLSSRPEVALQLAAWLQEAGIRPERIVIWDRTERELKSAGFVLGSSSGPRVVGTNGDWEEKVREWGPSGSRFARLLVDDVTAVINLAVLKDHGLAGVSFGMKNWYGVIHNPNKLHAEGCNPFVPHLTATPLLREKHRLTVIDGTVGQCHGGPGYAPSHAWPYQGYLASTDIVAADAAGWKVIEARRREIGMTSLAAEGREPAYIAVAARLGLGVADLAKIEVPSV